MATILQDFYLFRRDFQLGAGFEVKDPQLVRKMGTRDAGDLLQGDDRVVAELADRASARTHANVAVREAARAFADVWHSGRGGQQLQVLLDVVLRQ